MNQSRTCPMHEVLMKQRVNKLEGGVFYSHSQQLPNGDWEYCNGRLGYPSEQIANGSYRGFKRSKYQDTIDVGDEDHSLIVRIPKNIERDRATAKHEGLAI